MEKRHFCNPGEVYSLDKFACDSLSYLKCDEFQKLVASFGEAIPQTNDIVKLLTWLDEFITVWDYRAKQNTFDKKTHDSQRNLVHSTNLTDEQKNCTYDLIRNLNFDNIKKPLLDSYDYVIPVGGANSANYDRCNYAGSLLYNNDITTSNLVALSTFRPLLDKEKEKVESYASNATYEYEVICESLKRIFNAQKSSETSYLDFENMNNSHSFSKFSSQNQFNIAALSSNSSYPNIKRANTADTYEYFVKTFNPEYKSKILIVTSLMNNYYQQLEAIRVLGLSNNLYVETVGFPRSVNLAKVYITENYLQELKGCIDSLIRTFLNFDPDPRVRKKTLN